jgi:lysylphosphatidylglycerol synthetase-like protein (DUF2156 family)
MERPAAITGIAVLFFLTAIYLWAIGVLKLLAPDAISLMRGAPLMYGLELAGPYMTLLVGSAGYALVGWGLFRLHNWARWAAMAVTVLGVAVARAEPSRWQSWVVLPSLCTGCRLRCASRPHGIWRRRRR